MTVVDTQRLLRLIEEISEVEATIKWASNKKLHLEIALIRAIHTLSEVSLENVVEALESLRGGPRSQTGKQTKAPPARAEVVLKESTEGPVVQSLPKKTGEVSPSIKSDAEEIPRPEERFIQRSETPEPDAPAGSPWERVLQEVRKRRPLIISWIEPATPLSFENGTLKLGFPKDHSLAVESLSRPNNQKLLEEVVGHVLGGTWKLEFELRGDLPAAETKPALAPPTDPAEDFKKDPMIQKALEIFKAEIQSDR